MKTVYGFNVDVFNARMLEKLEAIGDAGKWNKPWQVIGGGYHNAESGRTYRGVNVLLLAMSDHGDCNTWCTNNGWQRLGFTVKQDELRKGTLIIWAAKVTPKGQQLDEGEQPKSFSCLRTFVVYAGTQVEGWQQPNLPARQNDVSDVVELYDALGVKYSWGGDRAYYGRIGDTIKLPHQEQFFSNEGLVGTALHEVIHWTGHASRLNRDGVTSTQAVMGTPEYAFEEIIAEAGSSILGAMLGLSVEPDEQVLAYIKNHARRLVDENKWALYKALKAASAAAEYVIATIGGNEDETVEDEG